MRVRLKGMRVARLVVNSPEMRGATKAILAKKDFIFVSPAMYSLISTATHREMNELKRHLFVVRIDHQDEYALNPVTNTIYRKMACDVER